jgi:hypothetical protein
MTRLNTVKVISTRFDELKRLLIKALRSGKSDVVEPKQLAPFGIDSNPIKDMIAVYGATGEKGKHYIIGYVRKDQLAGVGELRNYSTDEDGELKFYTWLKNDGTMEFNGDTDNLVRYAPLEAGFNKLRDDFNAHVQKYNAHGHLGVQPGAGTSGIPALLDDPSAATIDAAKIDEMKTF